MYAKTLNAPGRQQRQAGMTTLGMIILVSFIGTFVFAGLRLTPIYLNYAKVVGVVNGVATEFDGQNATGTAIRRSISRRFNIESVSEITSRDVKVTKKAGGYEVAATYSHKAPFVGNVSFVIDFDKRVMVRR